MIYENLDDHRTGRLLYKKQYQYTAGQNMQNKIQNKK